MEEHKVSRTLVNQTISKLLDFESIPGAKDSNPIKLPEHAPSEHPNDADTSAKTAGQATSQTSQQQQENRTLEKQLPANKSQIFVVVAWIFLFFIVWIVVGNKLQLPLGLEVVGEAYGNLFYIFMLILAGCVLSLTTWLYWKNKLTRTANVGVVIVIILSVSLPILTIGSGNGTTDIGRLTRTLSGFQLTTTAPLCEPVTGIIYSEDKPSAILGGKIMHEGDTHHGVTVVKIHKDKVEFEANGKRWIQRL